MEKEVLKFKETKQESQEKLPENVEIIETPEAKFRIIYSRHDIASQPEDMGKADAVAFEGIGDYTTKRQAEFLVVDLYDNRSSAPIVKRAKQEGKPIFFIDISEHDTADLIQKGLRALEVGVGFSLLLSLSKDIINKNKISRRDFLKKAAKGLGGLYFFSHIPKIIVSALDNIDGRSKQGAISRFLSDLDEKIHPETESIVLTLRNHLMAQKLTYIASHMRQSINKKPEIGLVIGAAHTGIEKALLEKNKERIALIDKLLRVPGLGKSRERIATIARLDFDEKPYNWVAQILEDPELIPIEK